MKRQGIRFILWAAAAVLIPACGSPGGGGGGGGGGSPAAGPLAAPTHPFVTLDSSTTASVRTGGGTGSTGKGGNGGGVSIRTRSASDMWVLKTGTVDSTFVLPDGDPYLGLNPRTISADTTLSVGTGLTAGSQSILGDDGLTTATGLWVQSGVTLTLDPNMDTDNADADSNTSTGTFEQASLAFAWSVFLEGTIKTGLKTGSPNRASLYLGVAASFVSRPGSAIDLAGADAGGGSNGANAGDLYLNVNNDVVNEASVTAKGGNGDAGGRGGNVEIYSTYYAVVNKGTITASGGTGLAGLGGAAGFVWMTSSFGPISTYNAGGVLNSGDISARGGDGTTGGGQGNVILSVWHNLAPAYIASAGPFVSSGAIDCSGGDATVSGNGGNAGGSLVTGTFMGTITTGIWFSGDGGYCRISGSLKAKGGNGAGAGNGGNGARIECDANATAVQPINAGLFIGASWDTRGGNGAIGGNGGDCVVSNNSDLQVNAALLDAAPTYFISGSGVDTTGGAGQTDGGNGGVILLTNDPGLDQGGNGVTGNFLNEGTLSSPGGAGTTGLGGNGGQVYLGDGAFIADLPVNAAYAVAPKLDRRSVNHGAVNARGGNGATTGGTGGRLELTNFYHVENDGAIDGSGGNGGTGDGGRAGGFWIHTEGVAINHADLKADAGNSVSGNGAAGTDEGGFNVSISTVEGRVMTHTGSISARGGTSVSGLGGHGGVVVLSSWDPLTPSTVSGTVSVPIGGGVPPGGPGQVRLDGINAVLTGGSVTF